MPEVCDFSTMFADERLRVQKDGPVRITTSSDAAEIFHFQAGGRASNQAVLVLNVRDNSERVMVRVNDRGIGDIEPTFGVDSRTWQTQSIVFSANVLSSRNKLRFEVRSGDIEVKDIVCWFHQSA